MIIVSENQFSGKTYFYTIASRCLEGYFGDPYASCRPECVTNSDCGQDKACVEQKCRNPCRDNTCGINAVCNVINRYSRNRL